jgi:nucleotide-binding universal stress UspA family protein
MRILIASNGSTTVDDILEFSRQFIHRASEPPTILKIIDPDNDRTPSRCDRLRNQACQILGTNFLTVCTQIGQAVDEIIHETQTGQYDLVIIDDRHPGWLARMVKISAAKRIAEQSACSVLIIRGEIGAGPVRNVLFCDSGAGGSTLVQKLNTKLAGLLNGEQDITILHIMSQINAGPDIHGKQLRSDADELIESHTPEGDLLSQDVQNFARLGIRSRPKVRHGLVVDEISLEANSGNYDLIVIGAHQRNWQRFLLDDLSNKIIERAEYPVLVVK